MGQIDIAYLYRILIEFQELDPGVAGRLLRRILEILRSLKKEGGSFAKKEEGRTKTDEMLQL
ncbi:MAG: hypothetical protein II882_03560 [Lachnospiraceae bacterium]|nr:hypothetical protein [Lachnospiraceae bacterium]